MYEAEHDRAHYQQAFSDVITFATEGLRAERVMVVYSGNGRLHNLDAAQIWVSEPVSLGLLQELVECGESRVFVDVHRAETNRTSITLSGICSILYVPIRARTGEVCGCCYLDSRLKNGTFHDKDLKQLEAVVAGRVEPLLRQTGSVRPLTWEVMLKTCWL